MAVKKSELYSTLWEACNKLRGGVEPSEYKDYVLVLLFFKYVTDKYKGQPFAQFKISEGASFDDLIRAKGKTDIGERVDKIIQKFLEDNKLQGALPEVSFNNSAKLGQGKELIDKVTGLIALFQNPALDFKNNRASGDDIIGDAYEFLMMKFAQESGKSKGQFYTPSEVSRVIARLIGISEIKPSHTKKWTLYDPAAGSGSLLIRAADEAPVNENGDSIVSIFGQEKYPDTAGLAKMNFILHNKGTGEIRSGSTLSNPQYIDEFNQLKKFDFIVMNPPFSDKAWSDGIKVDNDTYGRFDGFAIPPKTNGDFAWILHVIKSLDSKGKAGIIMPLGVLFRGNAEGAIRTEILKKRYIKGIVSLPANLFYGTSIAACILIIDKEYADERHGVFMIDASDGYKRDGSKNRLREQDIEKIVRAFNNREEIVGYSRFVSYSEIINQNGGDLKTSRYIQKINNELPQNIDAHLNGGIPCEDVDSLNKLWVISPSLKEKIFTPICDLRDVYNLIILPSDVEYAVRQDKYIVAEKKKETEALFTEFKTLARDILLNINESTDTKILIRTLGEIILNQYKDALLINSYDAYDYLLNYWNSKLQDDVYAIIAGGYKVGREIEYTYVQKKSTDKNSNTITVNDISKVKSFEGALIPREIIESEFFSIELDEIAYYSEKSALLECKLNEMREEESGDEGLLKNVVNDKGDGIPKANLVSRIKEIESKKTSQALTLLKELIELFDSGKTKEMQLLIDSNPLLEQYELKNRSGIFVKSKIKTAIKNAKNTNDLAEIPEIYKEEYDVLLEYFVIYKNKEKTDKSLKEARKALDEKVVRKYSELTEDEIKSLLYDKKWMSKIRIDIFDGVEQIINYLSSRVLLISKRYEHTLRDIENKTEKSREKVNKALERMGYRW